MIISLSFGDFANISGLMAKKMRAKHLIVNVVLRHKKSHLLCFIFFGGSNKDDSCCYYALCTKGNSILLLWVFDYITMDDKEKFIQSLQIRK